MVGWIKDFWMQFDKYLRLEKGFPSTFFLVPFKNRSGSCVASPHATRRATKYDVEDIPEVINKLLRAGKEVALHGIDAWHDLQAAVKEKERLQAFTACETEGIRMHWLCFSKDTPALLDQEGFGYDSTVGYNETIGYKAGTLQVFRPLGCRRLLELPLHVQDVAMFFPDSRDWRPETARRQCLRVFDQAEKHGGVVTLLWHERSLGPERQWGAFYEMLIRELERRKAWVTSASEIVAWFRSRRQITFAGLRLDGNGVKVGLDGFDSRPSISFTIRCYLGSSDRFVDAVCRQAGEIFIPLGPNPRAKEPLAAP
jgi:hypothetical protein